MINLRGKVMDLPTPLCARDVFANHETLLNSCGVQSGSWRLVIFPVNRATSHPHHHKQAKWVGCFSVAFYQPAYLHLCHLVMNNTSQCINGKQNATFIFCACMCVSVCVCMFVWKREKEKERAECWLDMSVVLNPGCAVTDCGPEGRLSR